MTQRIIRVCCLWLVTGFAISLPVTRHASADEFETSLTRGFEAFNERDMDLALSYAARMFRLKPHCGEAHILRQHVHFLQHDWDAVIADGIAFSQNKSTLFDGLPETNLVTCKMSYHAYYQKGEYGNALAYADELIRLKPDADAFVNRGRAYLMVSKYDKAITDCTKALRLNPDDAWAYHTRGSAFIKTGDFQQAITDGTENIRLAPDSAGGYFTRGTAYIEIGENDKAIVDLSEAIRLMPDLVHAYTLRGRAYREEGLLEKADDDLSKAKELTHQSERDSANQSYR